MADTKISALSAGTTLAGTEAIPMVQSAATVKTTPAALKTYALDGLTAASVTDFSEAVDDRVNALLVEGSNITLTYDDTANTLTVAATGGGSLPAEGSEGDVLTVVSGAWASAAPAEVDLGNLTDTWNNGSTVYTPIKLTVTRSAFGTGSRFLTIFDGATERFYVDPNGIRVSSYANTGDAVVTNFNGEIKAKSSGRIGFSSQSTVTHSTGTWETAWERGGTGFMELRGTAGTDGAAINFLEMGTAPATPGTGSAHLYIEDNGSGKTRLVIKYDTGNVAVINTDV